jgi:hypothetical protein
MPNDVAKFYYRNYFDTDLDGYTITSDYQNETNVNDRNKLTYAETSGEDTDGDSVDYEIDFTYDRDVDTIVLKSNLKTFTIYYWDGVAYQTFQSYASNTSEFLVISLTEQATSKIKITATHTITANEEKRIYLFEITKKIDEMNIEGIDISREWPRSNTTNVYGKSVQVIKYPNYGAVAISLSWENLTNTDFTAYKTMKDQMLVDSYAIYLYFSDTYDLLGEEAYYVVDDLEKYDSDPAGEAMTEGVNGSMELLEV